MKKDKKNYLGLAVMLGLGVMVAAARGRTRGETGRDIKLGVVADEGLGLVSISKDRQMISQMKIMGENEVWIPGGLGWYRAEVVKKILSQEKKLGWAKNIFIYSLGFYPDKIVWTEKIDDWKSRYWWQMLKNNNLLNKNENLSGGIEENEIYLDQVMPRDFAETKIVNENIKLSVINISRVNGLAGFVTKRLERLGFSVISVETEESERTDKCEILYGSGAGESYSLAVMGKMFDCNQKEDESLNENEIEIYLTDSFSTVINYPSYKK